MGKRNRKNNTIVAFTLAEVLLTLMIISIIAVLTIPSLFQNIDDARYKITWKKTFSDLSQATNRIMADNGGTLNSLFLNVYDIRDKYARYLNYAKKCDYGQNCWHDANNWYNLSKTPIDWGNSAGIALNNNVLLAVEIGLSNCTDVDYGLPVCGWIFVDINGFKSPNTVGKDIYLVWIQENKLAPAGFGDNYTNTCDISHSGLGCSSLYLRQ